ncbi:MAG TPA: hypothetical protein VFX58_04520 [Chitinophagaceae bacterium]|nr:hypothetical protein [Chitinophagaceae bacterium]
MRKLFLLCLLIPLFGISQNKNVVSTFRVFPKPDKITEFNKAFTAHAQKFHKGDWSWRVYSIESGPDAGGFHVTEGPLSWDQFEKRGNLGAEHTADWDKNVSPLTTGAGTSGYSEYNTDLSTVQVGDWADKIIITHMFPKPGMILMARDMVKLMKKAWEAGNESVAVYFAASSGAPQITTVNRLKAGLSELATGYRKPMPERFNAVNGEGAWTNYLADYAKCIEHRWSEMLFFRADLSSK